jgi:tellurite resistance protein TehA-like permease
MRWIKGTIGAISGLGTATNGFSLLDQADAVVRLLAGIAGLTLTCLMIYSWFRHQGKGK